MYTKLIWTISLIQVVLISHATCSGWGGDTKDEAGEQYLKTSWHFCRTQKKSEEVQDVNTGWFYCGEGAAAGGTTGFFLGGPLGAAAGTVVGCLGFSLNQSVLRKMGGSEAGDSHIRELNCMKEQIARYPIIVAGKTRTATMNPGELSDLITKCPNDDTTGPCDATIKQILRVMKSKA